MNYIKITWLLLLTAYSTLCAQSAKDINFQQEIPLDPTVKKGVLANGFTYFIKKNQKPENKAELRLIINAGSILEDEDQLGLAHFVEHMAFNGTKSFKKNDLIDYLQSIGIEFGADLNAHTSFDETVYKLEVPTDDVQVFNTSLQILREWADGITFDATEIENERGVVAEELRARSGAGMRVFYKSIPVLTNQSRYAKRTPIGTLDVILNSQPEALTRFYNDWYRPELMALVIVGDVAIDETEKKIQKLFSNLKGPHQPRERTYYSIPHNTAPKAVVITDKELTDTSISIYHKKEKETATTLEDYKKELIEKMYGGMLRERLSEALLTKKALFLSATAGIGHFLGDKNSFYLRANLKEEDITGGIISLLKESERVRRFGFSQTELDRYKAYMLNNARIRKEETGKLSSRQYAETLIDLFTHAKPVPGDTFIYDFYTAVLPDITLDEVNQTGKHWAQGENMAIVLSAPHKESLSLPDETALINLWESVRREELDTYEDSLENQELMTEVPKAGTVVKTDYIDAIDVTKWELGNGITVLAKSTNLQNNLISMYSFRSGGSSLAPDSLYVSARVAGNIITSGGINNISPADLSKLNMGKTLMLRSFLNFYEEAFIGSSSSQDLERMLQMTHLYFTKPNKDAKVFSTMKSQMIASVRNQESSPIGYLDAHIEKVMTNNHLRGISLTEEQINTELDLDKAYAFYKDRFDSANGFTFVFVGSFDIDVLQKQIERYLASLPSNLEEKNQWRDIGLRRRKGRISETLYKGVDDKAVVDMRFTGTLEFSEEKRKKAELLGKLLKIKLTEEMREKMAGVYGVKISGFATYAPYGWYRMGIRFTCAPENYQKLINAVFEEIHKVKENGATPEDVAKIQEAELANLKDGMRSNSYWGFLLKKMYVNGWKPEKLLNYESEIKKLTPEYFKEAAITFFNEDNYAQFVLLPENIE